MEINAKHLIVWILYNVLGLDGFWTGNLDSSINPMQVDKTRTVWLKQLSPYSDVQTSNRFKRFFEFHPVAFDRKSLVQPEQKFQASSQFPPFISGLQNFKKNSFVNDEVSSPTLNSIDVNNGEEPKTIRPVVDHFSGLRSTSFHLKDLKKDEERERNHHMPEEKQKSSLLQPVLKQNTQSLLRNKILRLLDTRQLIFENLVQDLEDVNKGKPSEYRDIALYDENSANKNVNSRLVISKNKHNHISDYVSYNSPRMLVGLGNFHNFLKQDNIQSYAKALRNNKSILESISPRFKKFPYILPEYDAELISKGRFDSQTDIGQDIEENTHDNELNLLHTSNQQENEFSFVNGLNGFKSSQDTGFDNVVDYTEPIEILDDFSEANQAFNDWSDKQYISDEYVNNYQGFRDNYLSDALTGIAMDNDFGDFGFIKDSSEKSLETSNDKTSVKHLQTESEEMKPHFGVETLFNNDNTGLFEDGFGSFNYDYNDCHNIETKACVTNKECSCYGLYQCHRNKCTANMSAADNDKEETSIGQWHDEPVVFDHWQK